MNSAVVRLRSRGGGTKVVVFRAWVGGGGGILSDMVLLAVRTVVEPHSPVRPASLVTHPYRQGHHCASQTVRAGFGHPPTVPASAVSSAYTRPGSTTSKHAHANRFSLDCPPKGQSDPPKRPAIQPNFFPNWGTLRT